MTDGQDSGRERPVAEWGNDPFFFTEAARGGPLTWRAGAHGFEGDALGPVRHAHDDAAEYYYMVSGSIVVEVGGERIAREADAATFDFDALRQGIAESQHPLVPVVRELARRCGEHGRHVHWGATTQDIMDTGLVLQVRDGLALLTADVERARAAARRLAAEHAETPMAGRTHGQHAVPITFGLKAASWADELDRARERLAHASAGLTAQLGGAAGTLASLHPDGRRVCEAFAEELGLACPPMPWHAARDRMRDLAHALDEVGAVGERIAQEAIRLQSTEVAEVAEPATAGHVGSSTMPQKRNPMRCEYLVASARVLRGVVTAVNGRSPMPASATWGCGEPSGSRSPRRSSSPAASRTSSRSCWRGWRWTWRAWSATSQSPTAR